MLDDATILSKWLQGAHIPSQMRLLTTLSSEIEISFMGKIAY